MSSPAPYLFTSSRLGFRNWETRDLEAMAAINADTGVMEFFPSTASVEKTAEFITHMQQQFTKSGFCYFAVETLADGAFIGFIGLMEKTFESDFTPCIDIGWRLDKRIWNRGYATEGARRCLQFAFETLHLREVFAMAPEVNIRSAHIMKKIGMQYVLSFEHPLLQQDERLRTCVLYKAIPTHSETSIA